MLVLSVMFSVPIFSMDTYLEFYTSFESGLRDVYQLRTNEDLSEQALVRYIEFHDVIIINVKNN